MSVGFNYVITFNNNGKVTDYQKSYNENYGKFIKIFLPLNFNNRKNYNCILSVAINNTFPKVVESVLGCKEELDLNCYNFDISELYRKYGSMRKLGLMRIKLLEDDGRCKFTSESFRA